MKRPHVSTVLFALLLLPQPRSDCQPPAFVSLNDAVTRFVEGSRKLNWEDPQGIFTSSSLELMLMTQLAGDEAHLMRQVVLLLSDERDVKSTVGQPQIADDVAIVVRPSPNQTTNSRHCWFRRSTASGGRRPKRRRTGAC